MRCEFVLTNIRDFTNFDVTERCKKMKDMVILLITINHDQDAVCKTLHFFMDFIRIEETRQVTIPFKAFHIVTTSFNRTIS